MLILAANYTFLFWLVVGNNSDQQLQQLVEDCDQDMFKVSACTVSCMQREQLQALQHQQDDPHQPHSPLLEKCFEACNKTNKVSATAHKNLTKIQETLTLNLICRDDGSLTFLIGSGQKSANGTLANSDLETASKNTSNPAVSTTISTLYFIKIHTLKDQFFVYLSDENFFTISKLKQHTKYNITVVAVHADQYSFIAKEEQFSTTQRNWSPGNVTELKVKNFFKDEENEMRLKATIIYRPPADMTCLYDILYFSQESAQESAELKVESIELQKLRHLSNYEYTLENLTFSSQYCVGLRAVNPNNKSKESMIYWKTFESPSCVEWYKYNFNMCAPLEPENLAIEEILVGENEIALNVTWKQPTHYPDNYTLRILDLDPDGKSHAWNISKHLNFCYIPNITLHGYMYEAHLTAYTPGGSSTAIRSVTPKARRDDTDKLHIVKLILVILAPILCIAILSLTIFVICHRRAKLKRYQERCKYFEELEKRAPIDPSTTFDFTAPRFAAADVLTQIQLDLEGKIFFNDAMEIDRNEVTLFEILGEGEFGLVRRGIYNNGKLGPHEVAVKMLKDHPSPDDISAFRREIEVMKSVDRHPNIVGIIGHCSKRSNEMMLLTEYCSLGNLLNFLRDEWKYLHDVYPNSNVITHLPSRLHDFKKLRKQPQAPQNQRENNLSNNNSVSYIETTIIEKIKMKYKRLNNTKQHQPMENSVTGSDIEQLPPSPKAVTPTKSFEAAADNKSYGYGEICTNSCKCQVIIKDIDDEALKPIATQTPNSTIEVKECECHQQMMHTMNEARNGDALVATPLSVENITYFDAGIQGTTHTICNSYRYGTGTSSSDSKANSDDFLITAAHREPLRTSDLLDIAKQVALGMEFLAKNKVVHRDLAARNVLVAPDRTIKIADFGLSRDVYQENIYKKTGNGKLPIKWLALESLTHQVYTTQSDVWSYGILLYEIVTLGGTPYPSVSTNRLLHLLKTGYRMEKPKNCGQEFYDLMYACWNAIPGERPNFTEIIKTLNNLLSETPQEQIGKALPLVGPNSESGEDSYLKPLK